jgi:hypothetical protein
MIWLALWGCADEAGLEAPDAVEDRTIDGAGLVLTAFPSVSVGPDGTTRALPRVVDAPDPETFQELELLRPFALTGQVEARTPVSIYRNLPGLDGPIAAVVDFRSVDTGDSVRVAANPTDGYTASIVEGAHTVTILPDDPNLGLTVFAADFLSNAPEQTLVVPGPLPVWGRVLGADGPRADATVWLATEEGIAGPPVRTDAGGWYTLQASEGLVVQVVTAGDEDGVQPEIASPPTRVTSAGTRVDLVYQDVLPVFLSLRVTGPGGRGQSALPYRLIAESIDGYGPEATVVQRGFTDAAGNLVTRALPGDYRLDLLVDDGVPISGLSMPVTLDGPTSLGTVELAPLVTLTGTVDDGASGVPDAQVTCREIDLAQRTWTTTTDAEGDYVLEAPAGPLACVVLPPEQRTDVAAERFFRTPDDDTYAITLRSGRTLTGRVTLDGDPESFAVVEVRTTDGVLLGSDLTSTDGRYRIRVQP